MSNTGLARFAGRPLLARAQVSGARVTIGHVTDTGGSGLDATSLSGSLEEAHSKAVTTYREILRDIPAMRENFTIIEDEQYLRRVIRYLFDRHANISDPKIIDMMVFKARQEAGEIRNQWKSRYHVYQHINAYRDEQVRQKAMELARVHAHSEGGGARRQRLVDGWKARGLVPAEIDSWEQYEHWKADEDGKFALFANQHAIFTPEQLERNEKAKNQCVVM